MTVVHYGFTTQNDISNPDLISPLNPSGWVTGLAVMGIMREDHTAYETHHALDWVPDSALNRPKVTFAVVAGHATCTVSPTFIRALRQRLERVPRARLQTHMDEYEGLRVLFEDQTTVVVDHADADLYDPTAGINAQPGAIPPIYSQFEGQECIHHSTFVPPSSSSRGEIGTADLRNMVSWDVRSDEWLSRDDT